MDMLTFSKEREPDLAPAQLNETAGDVVELMQTRAAEAGVELQFRPAENLPIVSFDPEAIHRAILNVVTNAIDACEKDGSGRVTVSTEHGEQKGVLRVVVEDNGEGIAPQDIKRIFSVFESRKGGRGTGLGLPVSQKILQEHNGEIHVETEPRAGSRFVLELPAVLASRGGTDVPRP
jgi:signal transduction histidine kinase